MYVCSLTDNPSKKDMLQRVEQEIKKKDREAKAKHKKPRSWARNRCISGKILECLLEQAYMEHVKPILCSWYTLIKTP